MAFKEVDQKVCIVLNSLVQGGAQRAGITLAADMQDRGYSVMLLVFYPESTDFFSIPDGILVKRFIHPFEAHSRVLRILGSGRFSRWVSRLQDLKKMRKMILDFNPKTVVAFEAYVGVLVGLSLFKSNLSLLISERVHPKYHAVHKPIDRFQTFVYRQPNVQVISQGEMISEYIRNKYDISVLSIPNTVSNPPVAFSRNPEKSVVVLARYSHQKGIDILLDSWAALTNEQRDGFSLQFYGQGNSSEFLGRAKSLEIASSVNFYDAATDIDEILSRAGIFVLPSRYEGFPNALAEALARGVPSISSDCPSAIRDLTGNGELALLFPVEDRLALRNRLISLMQSEELREDLGERGTKVLEMFNSSRVTDIWEDAINASKHVPQNPFCNACGLRSTSERLITSRSKIIQDLEGSLELSSEIQDSLRDFPALIRFWKCANCHTLTCDSVSVEPRLYEALHSGNHCFNRTAWEYQVVEDYFQEITRKKIYDLSPGSSKWSDKAIGQHEILFSNIDEIVKSQNASLYPENINNEQSSNECFDAIIACHILQHVANPVDILRRLVRILKKDGEMFISVSNVANSFANPSSFDWPPIHLTRFSVKGIIALGNRVGLEFVHIIPGATSDAEMLDFMIQFKKV